MPRHRPSVRKLTTKCTFQLSTAEISINYNSNPDKILNLEFQVCHPSDNHTVHHDSKHVRLILPSRAREHIRHRSKKCDASRSASPTTSLTSSSKSQTSSTYCWYIPPCTRGRGRSCFHHTWNNSVASLIEVERNKLYVIPLAPTIRSIIHHRRHASVSAMVQGQLDILDWRGASKEASREKGRDRGWIRLG